MPHIDINELHRDKNKRNSIRFDIYFSFCQKYINIDKYNILLSIFFTHQYFCQI